MQLVTSNKLIYENGSIKNGKDQGSIQLSTAPDLGHNMGK